VTNTLIDAGPVIALFDRSDQWNARVTSFFKGFGGKLVTTWPVITEISHLLGFNVNVQVDFLKWIDRGAISLVEIRWTQLKRIIELTTKYSDRPMDLADASIVVVAEDLGINRIITLDSDYLVYRISGQHRFENLLSETR
jgi:predicted nucleic acid-binding protein